MIVSKLRGVRERMRALGERCGGQRPFVTMTVRRPFSYACASGACQGLTYRTIAEQMNLDGIPTRTRGRWHAMAVHRILKRTI